MFIGFPGELFVRMLMLVVLPLIASSVITSLTIIDKITAKKIGKRAAVYFLVTSLLATSLAVVLGRVIIKPRAHENDEIQEEDRMPKEGSSPVYAILDMLR
jgi:Na+/H+-dicarboxylate symporter